MERGCEHCDLDLQKASEAIKAAYSLMDCDHVYEESKKVRLVLDIVGASENNNFSGALCMGTLLADHSLP